jgi:enoyl-CoA hydratase
MSDLSSTQFSFINVSVDEAGIAQVMFNRPEVRNAIHLPMNLEIRGALEALAEQPDVRAVIFVGAGGKAFAGGADIAELNGRAGVVALAQHNARLCEAIERFPQPTIAAIHGYALGGGCEVAMACDLRVAGSRAKLGQPEVSLGIIPAAGGTWRLQRLVGVARAKELIFTGALIEAAEAERWGLINHVVDDSEVLNKAVELARAISAQSALAVRLAKVVINAGRETDHTTGSTMEALAQMVLYDDDDKERRMNAFIEAREARRRKRDENS